MDELTAGQSKSEKCDICLQKETLEDSLLDVEGNVFDRMCVFDQMCQAADLWPQDDSDDSDEGSDDSQETDESANEPLVLEDINPGKEADDAASEFYEPDRPFKRVSDVEIKVVTAFRGHAHQSDFGCIKIPAFQDTNHGSESESGSHSEYGTECGSDCGSDINCYHNPAFKSRSRSNVYDKTKQEDERIAEMEESDEEDLDLDDSDTHLEEEIADIVEEEKKFCRFVGYHPRIEKLCYWVGSDYLKRREQL